MQNFKITIQYDGTRYDGWQKQGNTKKTIQGRIEMVLSKLTGRSVEIHGAGRTDAGVHAMAQVANFHLEDAEIPEDLFTYLNHYLPSDIAILKVETVPPRFHSRLNAVSKTYEYRLLTNDVKNVFERNYIYTIPEKLDITAMQQAASYLIGTHDFKSFCSNKRIKKSTARTITDIQITQQGDEIRFTYSGNGFLYHMIRIITGTLVEVGLYKRTPHDIPTILSAGQRTAAGITMPAKGLCLMEVGYPTE